MNKLIFGFLTKYLRTYQSLKTKTSRRVVQSHFHTYPQATGYMLPLRVIAENPIEGLL